MGFLLRLLFRRRRLALGHRRFFGRYRLLALDLGNQTRRCHLGHHLAWFGQHLHAGRHEEVSNEHSGLERIELAYVHLDPVGDVRRQRLYG